MMRESVEMYLVMTALLRGEPQQPVPISQLAAKLAVAQVSAHEMCRKLTERGLIAYQPYKGVTLTEEGEALAQQILSRRRLWVVFLVENLGIEPQEADDLACQLEHITSERLVQALRAFLERPPAAPERLVRGHAGDPAEAVPLAACGAGAHGRVVAIDADPVMAGFLLGQGVRPDAPVEVLAVGGDGTVLLGVGRQHVALAASVAAQVLLAPAAEICARQQVWERCCAFWSCPQAAGELQPVF